MIAPIAPHLAEELYEHGGGSEPSVFLTGWANTPVDASADPAELLLTLRSGTSALFESARAAKQLKAPSEAQLWLWGDGCGPVRDHGTLVTPVDANLAASSLARVLGVSEVHLERPEAGSAGSVEGTCRTGEPKPSTRLTWQPTASCPWQSPRQDYKSAPGAGSMPRTGKTNCVRGVPRWYRCKRMHPVACSIPAIWCGAALFWPPDPADP